MFRASVLTLFWLFVPLCHPFSFDIVVGKNTGLEFYLNGTLTHTEDIPSVRKIISVTYDPEHYRVLFASSVDFHTTSISSFDITTRNIQPLLTRTTEYYTRVVYDPGTQTLYWKDGFSIYSFSLIPASSNKADGNLLLTLDKDYICHDIAVDSCGGYVYWITDYGIERARLDGTEREVLINNRVYIRRSLAIDRQTQKMYWTEQTQAYEQWTIEHANLNGKNRTTLYTIENVYSAFSLAVSKDFIYWQNYDQNGIWQLPKYSSREARKLRSLSTSNCDLCHRIAANYTVKEQIQGIKSCDALPGPNSYHSKSESEVSICQNYCIQGECSVSAEGQPTCSCKAGYSGERCEVSACHQYCLNGGVCSLNEASAPVCQCTTDYEGEGCEFPVYVIKCDIGYCG